MYTSLFTVHKWTINTFRLLKIHFSALCHSIFSFLLPICEKDCLHIHLDCMAFHPTSTILHSKNLLCSYPRTGAHPGSVYSAPVARVEHNENIRTPYNRGGR